jgi:predicted RNase H-like HicB family nuclease
MGDDGELTMKHRLTLSFTVVVEPDEEGFHEYAPAFKGLHVDGKTRKEALRLAIEAVGVYLRSLARTGDPLPVGPDFSIKREMLPTVPSHAQLHNVKFTWPSLQMCGVS